MNDFRRDDDWQKEVRDALLAPVYYGKYAVDGRYVVLDRGELPTLLQRRCAVDTIVQGREGHAVCIEEKIVRWPGYEYDAYCLETDSCTKPGHESKGWMHYGRADFLLYCFMRPDGLDCHRIAFPKLKEWFWPIYESLPTFGPLKTFNRTAGRKASINLVRQNVGVHSYFIRPNWEDPRQAALFSPDKAEAA